MLVGEERLALHPAELVQRRHAQAVTRTITLNSSKRPQSIRNAITHFVGSGRFAQLPVGPSSPSAGPYFKGGNGRTNRHLEIVAT